MKTTKNGFSIIEIIITIGILVIIGVIASTTYSYMLEKTYDGKITNDLINIRNSIETYYKENQKLPLPKGNQRFYNIDGGYEHNYEDKNTFGVSGYITETTIEKRYMNYLPLDPRTNQYYGYAKTKQYEGYEISGVIQKEKESMSKVEGKWSGRFGPKYLIKEYNGPNFVSDKSKQNFPYNPNERKLIAKINSYSGTIKINDKTLTTSGEILNYTILEGDKLEVGTGGTTEIYYSDGSNSLLGDQTQKTILEFTNMNYKEENNLFTTIRLTLDMGSVWTKASKLADKSEFEIETQDAVAAVRGTIFGLKKDSNQTNIILNEGLIEVNKITETQEKVPLTSAGLPTGTIEIKPDGKTYIEVEKGETAKGITITTPQGGNASTTNSLNQTQLQGQLNPDQQDFITNPELTNPVIPEGQNCNKGYEKYGNECVEMKKDCATETTNSTGAFICAKHQEILKREPILRDFDKLMELSSTGAIEQEISVNGYLNYKKNREKYFNPNYECIGQRSFKINFGCIENDLINLDDKNWKVVAYAPYQAFGYKYNDYNNDYDRFNGFFGFYKDSNTFLTGSQQALIGEGDRFIPYFTGGIFQSGSSVGSYNSNFQTNKNSFRNNNLKFNFDNHYIKDISSGERGIFIDNVGNDSYLKYDINDLELNTGSGFAIEMSVRGAALKRNGPHFLFQMNNGLYSYIYKHTDNNYYLTLGSYSGIYKNIKVLKLTSSEFEPNKFYKIRYQIFNGIVDPGSIMEIKDENNISYGENVTGSGDLSLTGSNIISNIYIGGRNNNGSQFASLCPGLSCQWNDIIDYVKIYRK